MEIEEQEETKKEDNSLPAIVRALPVQPRPVYTSNFSPEALMGI